MKQKDEEGGTNQKATEKSGKVRFVNIWLTRILTLQQLELSG